MQLLSPLALRGCTAPSRVLFGPHETNLCRGRSFSERSVAYYRRRAAGGAGIVVTEEASVHASDWPYERSPLAADCPRGWAAVAAAVHEHGALAVAALGHAGGQGSSAYSQRELWAPSHVPEVSTREVPKAMEPADIDAVVAGFAAATTAAVDAGMDGVEINAGQHSLVRQFLSGLTNLRTDGYGTDRLRFAREVLIAVRAVAGDTVVGLRLSCDELAPWAGLVPEAAAAVARELSAYVDYLVVVRGSIFTVSATRPDGHVPPGFNLAPTALVRAAVPTDVAVVLQGSIVDVAMAEEAVGSGVCQAVEMTRAQIADPDLVTKGRAAATGRIRPCILCNQACQVRDPRNPLVSCVGEPGAGHETEDAPVEGRTPAPRRVLVVGGGPAGLETARVAAQRGHDVRLVDRAPVLGGALRTAAQGAGRERLGLLADWLAAECVALGVDVVAGTGVGPAEVTAAAAEGVAVVIATGGTDGRLPFSVDGDGVVVTARALLAAADGGPDATAGPDGSSDTRLPEGPVAVWDPLGGPVGVSVAELLARSRPVTLVTPDPVVGTQLARTGDLAPAQQRLHAAGVALVKRATLRRVTSDGAECEDRFSGERIVVPAVAVVACGPELPDEELAVTADRRHPRVGDAVAPRTIYEAVLEGRLAALALDADRNASMDASMDASR